MAREFPESDWKVLRQLHKIALDRYCQRLLCEVGTLLSDASRSHHERFLAISEHLYTSRKEMARAFDDMRRSQAWLRILSIWSLGVMTEEELARFSPETQASVKSITESD